jgi:amino acid adenylation domain-containing protein
MILESHTLSPAQQGMLFQTLVSPDTGAYLNQMIFDFPEALHPATFWRAWEQVVESHPILRSSVRWVGLEEPVLDVHDHVNLSIVERDLRELPDQKQKEYIESYLHEDRCLGVDLNSAPLMRFTLFRLQEAHFYFIRTYHHIISDGRSTVLLIRQVFDLYQSYRKGQNLQLPPGKPFRAYVDWLAQQDFSKAELYWKERLKGFASPTLVRVSPSMAASHSGEFVAKPDQYGLQSRHLPERLAARLDELAREHQLTVNTFLQAAYAILLSRYSSTHDIVFGATRACRRSALGGQAEEIIGPLINTLPVRILVQPHQTLLPWLKGLRDQWVALRDYEHTPLSYIQEWIGFSAGKPLFESVYNFDYTGWESIFKTLGEEWNERQVRLIQNPPYPLALSGYAQPDFLLMLNYDRLHFSDRLAERMLDQLQVILEGMAANPQARLGEIPFLTVADRQQILVDWNTTEADYPSAWCAHQLFEDWVQRSPDTVAIITENALLSYREVDERANILAHYLRAIGVGPEVLVGICVERSVEMILGVLGVYKAGGAYLPLDASYPAERLLYMLKDSCVQVVLTQERLLTSLPAGIARVVVLDRDWSEIARSETSSSLKNPTPEVHIDNLAYVIYTSGSTGRPKGVMVTHRGIGSLAKFQARIFSIRVGQRVLQLAPFSFDASVWEIWMALGNGGTLVLPSQAELESGFKLLDVLAKYSINVVTVLPSVLDALPENRGTSDEIPDLKTLILASEPGSREIVEKWGSGRAVFDAYGPTETTVCATVGHGRVGDEWAPPIGKPISNVKVYVLDENLQPVPHGVAGELYVVGLNLARGYLNRPEATAERFLPDPFGLQGDRMYRTGDVVHYREDGNLEFVGRVDTQVKVRGYRVEIGEVESVLAGCPGVHQAVVVAHKDGLRDSQKLIAYIVASDNVDWAKLRAHLLSKLPEFMVPSTFIFLSQFPLAPNGKVDRQALPVPTKDLQAQHNYIAPRDKLEVELCRLWESVLKVHPIGVQDNLFELGVHSLTALRLVGRLEEFFGVQFSVKKLFHLQTIAELADELRHFPDIIPPKLVSDREKLRKTPLSLAQLGLWFVSQLDGHGVQYNIPYAFRLIGSLNIQALKASFNSIAQRHEILRTQFMGFGESPSQLISPDFELNISMEDLSELSTTERDVEVRKLALEFGRRSFELEKAPPWRLKLIRLTPSEHVLLLNFHHIIFDERSFELLLQELSAFYRAYHQGRTINLPELALQYGDFAVWQHEWLKGEEVQAHLDYWVKQLAGAPAALDFFTDKPRPSHQTINGASCSQNLPHRLKTALKQLGQAEKVTLFAVLLAAFQVLLYRWTGQEDICIGSPFSARYKPEFENLIGLFLNTQVLRARPSAKLSFRQFLRQVNQTLMETFDHQMFPFEMLVQQLHPERDRSRQPLFQVLFNYQPDEALKLELPDLVVNAFRLDYGLSKFDLNLYITEEQDGLSARLNYCTDLFEEDTAKFILHWFQILLENIVVDPDLPVAQIPLLHKAEKEEILRFGCGPKIAFPIEGGVHQLFEAQVQRTPEAVAIIDGEQKLSYKELNTRANRLAHYLCKQGSGPERPVGILIQRSSELVVAFLAVLKSGAVCVLLDPEYPVARLAYMLSDSRVELLLSQEALVAPLLERESKPAGRLIYIDRDRNLFDQESPDNLALLPRARSLAYIYYTSGSTGHPKGVMVPHSGLINCLLSMISVYGLNQETIALQITSISFDASIRDFFAPLAAGGKLVMLRQDEVREPHRLIKKIHEQGVNCILSIVPTFLRALLAATSGMKILSNSMRMILPSGEILAWEDIRRVRSIFGDSCRVVNQYGPTECTMISTYFPVPEKLDSSVTVPIGRSIANVQVYILDMLLNPVPVGMPGDVYIGGAGVSRGYLNQPHLTAAVFLPDPLAETAGSRMYRTGDRGRYLSDGNLEFLGRKDFQVKVRGVRIELGEIEALLRTHPVVKDCVVIPKYNEFSEGSLVAYLVPVSGEQITSLGLQKFLAEQLPNFMVPSSWVILEDLPKTPNGKINRLALLRLQSQPPVELPVRTAPRDETEGLIASIWSELLGLDQVDMTESFFLQGGHSLLAMRLLSRIRNDFNVDVPVGVFLENPTLIALAEVVKSLRWLFQEPLGEGDNFEFGEI